MRAPATSDVVPALCCTDIFVAIHCVILIVPAHARWPPRPRRRRRRGGRRRRLGVGSRVRPVGRSGSGSGAGRRRRPHATPGGGRRRRAGRSGGRRGEPLPGDGAARGRPERVAAGRGQGRPLPQRDRRSGRGHRRRSTVRARGCGGPAGRGCLGRLGHSGDRAGAGDASAAALEQHDVSLVLLFGGRGDWPWSDGQRQRCHRSRLCWRRAVALLACLVPGVGRQVCRPRQASHGRHPGAEYNRPATALRQTVQQGRLRGPPPRARRPAKATPFSLRARPAWRLPSAAAHTDAFASCWRRCSADWISSGATGSPPMPAAGADATAPSAGAACARHSGANQRNCTSSSLQAGLKPCARWLAGTTVCTAWIRQPKLGQGQEAPVSDMGELVAHRLGTDLEGVAQVGQSAHERCQLFLAPLQ